MAEDGIDISHHTSNNVEEYRNIAFDFVITVYDHARERRPFFPSGAKVFHHDFPDPAKAAGTEAQIARTFREVREQIRAFAKQFAAEHL